MSTKNFLTIPNLPQKQVTGMLVDWKANQISNLPAELFLTPKTKLAYPAISSHPDILLHHLGGNTFVAPPEIAIYFKKNIPGANILEGKSPIGKHYPEDIAYNVARINRIAFHNTKFTDPVICEYFEQNGVTLIDVKQGYSKCSVCIVSENAIITSDMGIAKKADLYQLDVLKIQEGYILLDGFSHGFIGGATGLISPEILAVNGDLSTHPDYESILLFCEKHHVQILSLHQGIPKDIGSMIPIFE